MNFGGSNLPRDANVSTSLVTSPYDVSRGNFSGGLLNIRSRPGSNYIVAHDEREHRRARSCSGPIARGRALGQQYANVSVGGALSGPIQPDKSFFNRRTSPAAGRATFRVCSTPTASASQTAGIVARTR